MSVSRRGSEREYDYLFNDFLASNWAFQLKLGNKIKHLYRYRTQNSVLGLRVFNTNHIVVIIRICYALWNGLHIILDKSFQHYGVIGTKPWISLAFPLLINSLSFEKRIPIWTFPPCLMMSLCGRLLSMSQIHHCTRPHPSATVRISLTMDPFKHGQSCVGLHHHKSGVTHLCSSLAFHSFVSNGPHHFENETGPALVHLFSWPYAWWAWTNLICHLSTGCFGRWRITWSFEDINLTNYWHYVTGVARWNQD